MYSFFFFLWLTTTTILKSAFKHINNDDTNNKLTFLVSFPTHLAKRFIYIVEISVTLEGCYQYYPHIIDTKLRFRG